MKKKLLLLALSCTLLVGCGSNKIDLIDFISVEFSGGNGAGTASVSLDTASLRTELSENYKGAPINESSDISSIISSINYSFDNNSELSNGDEILLEITWNETIVENAKYTFNAKTQTYKIAGLPERETLDLFDGVELIYDGVSPNASVLVRTTSDNTLLENVRYNIDKYQVANGDEIVVTASFSTSVISENDYIIPQKEKTFTVQGADEYVKSYSDIDEDAIARLTAQSDDILASTLANKSTYLSAMHQSSSSYGFDINGVTIKSKELKSIYFASFKDGLDKSWGDVYNSTFLVYEVTATDSLSETVTALVTIYCKDFIKRAEGDTSFEISNVVYNKGFATQDQLTTNVVDTNKAKYEFEIIEID